MLNTFTIVVVCQLVLLSVSCNDQHDSGFLLQCDSSCTLPEFPVNGRYTVLGAPADTHPGTVVPNSTVIQYNCDVGYVPYQYSIAVCIDGTWDTQFTKCQKKVTCPLPTNPAHGSYELSDLGGLFVHGTEVPNWSTAIYSCDATFEIVGKRTALCYNGLWTTEPPQCQKSTACVVPDPPTKGSYSILGSQDAPVAGSTVNEFQIMKYDCSSPNILQGASFIFCENGNWLPEIPSCRVHKDCTLPPVPVNAKINGVVDVDHSLVEIQVTSLSGVEYSCDAAFELTGTANISCYDGSWSSEPPHCKKSTFCILPDLPLRGSYSIVGSMEAPVPGAAIAGKEALLYKCKIKNRDPTDQVIVCAGGKWLPGVVECLDSPLDCGDVFGDTSGVYLIQPNWNSEPFAVYCDLRCAGHKWTVIQQRFSGDVDFYRSYKEYREGFGTKMGSHWLGLEHIHEITKGGHHELYIELEAYNGTKAYARYETFIVGNSSTGFQLTINGYSGTAGDSMTISLNADNLNGMKFSTYDKDQDGHTGNCAKDYHGAWWYNHCMISNLNGVYHDTAVDDYKSMTWRSNFDRYALKTARMLIRRK